MSQVRRSEVTSVLYLTYCALSVITLFICTSYLTLGQLLGLYILLGIPAACYVVIDACQMSVNREIRSCGISLADGHLHITQWSAFIPLFVLLTLTILPLSLVMILWP